MSQRSVVEVFTNKSTEFMLEYGGSASWVIGLGSASGLKYCICSRNDERPREDDHGDRPQARNEAFLVGKVSGIEFVERQNNRDRYLIKFSEYAEVSKKDFRHGMTRNPVVYSDVEHCRTRGIDIDALDFKPMPPVSKKYFRHPAEITDVAPASMASTSRKGLSMAEAKEELAVFYDVPAEAIQITITG
ncbi:hypothetical protein HZF05_14505 [Sphingomonas sp. CGMCC 1.13654]|uniref:Uncharacterized protein n=1 Tax=Sphingomonas chungangi TaxID=2683589 RepID=A0A838LAX6_9SPHN|nr:hypothetical protein [Sphingomonas chungangi]MBA2935296.1 hypothetical protein [Sphingomonas chungangi]MVW56803.1 hypothetical protein [Sphingomonas chungangi]